MRTEVLRRFQLGFLTSCAVMLAAALTACAGMDPPLDSSPPTGKAALPVETITPQYSELPIDRTSGPAPAVPWQLIRVDREENRIYLSASTSGCSKPETVRVTESASSIQLTVTGTSGSEPCSMQYVTLIGYVQLSSIGGREVTGNAG